MESTLKTLWEEKMTTKLKRKLLLALLGTCTVLSLTGCGKSKHGTLTCEQLNTQYNSLLKDYTQMKDSSVVVGVNCLPTGEGNFVEKDAKYVFSDLFGFPGSQAGVPGYTVNFNEDTCSISPTSNWVVDSVGSVIYVYNTELGISGEFSYGRHPQENVVDVTTLRSYLDSWTSIGKNIVKRDIYLGDSNTVGQSASFEVAKDTSGNATDLTVHCGLIGTDVYDVSYVFVYKGITDSNKNDSILALLRSLKIEDKEMRMQ